LYECGDSSLVRRVTSPKTSKATYIEGRSLVKVKVNIFYILFGHTLDGTVSEYQAVLC